MWFPRKKQADITGEAISAIHKTTFDNIDKATKSIDKATVSIDKLTSLLDDKLGTTELIFYATGGDKRNAKSKKKS